MGLLKHKILKRKKFAYLERKLNFLLVDNGISEIIARAWRHFTTWGAELKTW